MLWCKYATVCRMSMHAWGERDAQNCSIRKTGHQTTMLTFINIRRVYFKIADVLYWKSKVCQKGTNWSSEQHHWLTECIIQICFLVLHFQRDAISKATWMECKRLTKFRIGPDYIKFSCSSNNLCEETRDFNCLPIAFHSFND